ncbi:hypothetical protein MNBD_GAMMA12-2667 [hydrothermal vent metagenome]|uniref:SRPBCC family protein n=1 Tax=hydrothermal vent metagenome TaxID=652676 RepID=A0A3B0YH10_9ZZZZ
MKLKMTACIEAPKEKVWNVLSDIENVHLWIDPIISAHCEYNNQSKVGTIRTCNLKGNMRVQEKWIEWNEGDSFTYQAFGAPLIKSAKNTWSVKSVNGNTLLTTESVIELKGGILGKLLNPLMLFVSKKMGGDSLAAIKYLIETGHPYEKKFSKLPRVPISC